MKVLCISGKAGSGKDTLANLVQNVLFDVYEEECVIVHYADMLKHICKDYFFWDGNKDAKGRRMLQEVGTDIFRKMDNDYWVKIVIPIIKAIGEYNDIKYVIVPDCRFRNEIDWLVNNFDTIHVRVIRPSSLTGQLSEHVSETDLDGVTPDYYIDNSGAVADLYPPAVTLSSWMVE